MSENLQYRISSALKDIIGRDLITDDYVAIFELVKNSFDAHASEVIIEFKYLNTNKARIIISDNGKGMSREDISKKWLFVAYSAKKDGTEDNNYDYRDNIFANRPFAGAKGIGRFSCDRLGKKLYLETTKRGTSKTQILRTNWENFEVDAQKEFVDIPVEYMENGARKYPRPYGTVLEISELRSKWSRDKLLKLKDSLSKLINPINDNDENFIIIIRVSDELDKDNEFDDYKDKVNGKVKNFIFEQLGLKTTKICSRIKNNNDIIVTTLVDGGTLIYKIKQHSEYELLHNIKITLYYLSRKAKYTFTKQMGMASRLYGNLFLYKNGFRVYPYGEPNSDPMGIDKRKSRKQRSRLGTGEIIGRVEITEAGNNHFVETSSRGDGLIKNEYYDELTKFVFQAIEMLEKYVVDVQQWGFSIEDDNNTPLSSRVIDLLATLTNSENIVDFQVPENFIDIIEASQINSANSVVKNLKAIAKEIGDENLLGVTEKAIEKVEYLRKAKEEADRLAKEAEKKAQEATRELKTTISENLFLKSINTSDYKEMISLLHHVGIYAGTIENKLKGISLRTQRKIPISNEELWNIIDIIGLEVKKISNIAIFATKARFNLKTEATIIDINNYIKEYVQNIIPTINDKKMRIKYVDDNKDKYEIEVKPIEINIIIDNMVSNARKAKAKVMVIKTQKTEKGDIEISFKDDGVGIKEEEIKNIYNMGYTTTDGSGVGLYHVKRIVESMAASIAVKKNETEGVTFKILIKEKT